MPQTERASSVSKKGKNSFKNTLNTRFSLSLSQVSTKVGIVSRLTVLGQDAISHATSLVICDVHMLHRVVGWGGWV